MAKQEKVVTDWLQLSSDLLSKNNNNTHSETVNGGTELSPLSHVIFDLLEHGLSDQMMTDVCDRLVSMFRCRSKALHLTVIEFLPSLIWSYLSNASSSKSKLAVKSLEACLLTLYNLFASLNQSIDRPNFITIPSTGRPSIYHESFSLGSNILTETALSRYDQGEKRLPLPPFPQIDKLNSKNRFAVLSSLVRCYAKEVGLLSDRSLKSLCDLTSKVCCAGFNTFYSRLLRGNSDPLLVRPRIPATSEFLCELLNVVYFIMFNGQPQCGLEALECIHQRANYELFSNVLLLTNAIKNSLVHNPSGHPHDGPMGVSIAITPACILNSLNKEAITNASFKSTKLPDDITPEDGVEDGVASDSETETKSNSAQGEKQLKILSGIKLGGPLKSAIKRVERTISAKKESKDGSMSPARTSDKVDGHTKISRANSGGKQEKMGSAAATHHDHKPIAEATEMEELKAEAPSLREFEDAKELEDEKDVKNDMDVDDSFHSLDHDKIQIIVEPPALDSKDSNDTKL